MLAVDVWRSARACTMPREHSTQLADRSRTEGGLVASHEGAGEEAGEEAAESAELRMNDLATCLAKVSRRVLHAYIMAFLISVS